MNISRWPIKTLACLVLAGFISAGISRAQDSGSGPDSAKYELNVDLKEDTYRSSHKLNFSKMFFNKITLSTNNELSSMIVSQSDGNKDKSVIQKRANMNLNYRALENLRVGCNLRGSDDADNRRSNSSSNYSFNANYNWKEHLRVSQTLGGISEYRLNTRDDGVQYHTTATITVPDQPRTSMSFRLGSTGNNLQWGKLGFNGGGNINYHFTEENKIKLDLYQDWSADKDLSVYGGRQYSYTVNSMKRRIGINSDYDVGLNYKLGFDAGYDQSAVETDDESGLARSTDFSNRQLRFGASLLEGNFGIFNLTGSYTYTTGAKSYEDKTRNENRTGFNAGAQLYFKEHLDSLVISGNLEKSSLFDADSVDDRDNVTIKGGIQYPWQVLPRLRLKLAGNIYINKLVYIHPQKSMGSKWNTLYKLEPILFYQISPRITFIQTYLLSSRYIESIVKELYDLENIDDKLYRTFRVDNSAQVRLSDRFRASLAYDLETIENCRFEGGIFEDEFIRSTDSRQTRHAGRLSFSYQFLPGVSLSPQYILTYKKTLKMVRDSAGRLVSETPSSYSLHTAQLKVEYTVLDKVVMDFTLRQTLRVNVMQEEDRDNYMTLNIVMPLF